MRFLGLLLGSWRTAAVTPGGGQRPFDPPIGPIVSMEARDLALGVQYLYVSLTSLLTPAAAAFIRRVRQ